MMTEDMMRSFESDDPFGLPTYSTRLGDSGWRIYIDNLTPERLKTSYQDTLQYLNLQDPERSLLFAYGKGDVGVSFNLQHPKLYPTDDELMNVDADEIETTNYTGYQRLVSWSKLTHLSPIAIRYSPDDLEHYQSTFKDLFNGMCMGCHSGNPINTTEVRAQGGFAFLNDPMTPSELSGLTPLMDLENPAQSALIRLIYGEFDHIDLTPFASVDVIADYEAAALVWIERFR